MIRQRIVAVARAIPELSARFRPTAKLCRESQELQIPDIALAVTAIAGGISGMTKRKILTSNSRSLIFYPCSSVVLSSMSLESKDIIHFIVSLSANAGWTQCMAGLCIEVPISNGRFFLNGSVRVSFLPCTP